MQKEPLRQQIIRQNYKAVSCNTIPPSTYTLDKFIAGMVRVFEEVNASSRKLPLEGVCYCEDFVLFHPNHEVLDLDGITNPKYFQVRDTWGNYFKAQQTVYLVKQ